MILRGQFQNLSWGCFWELGFKKEPERKRKKKTEKGKGKDEDEDGEGRVEGVGGGERK